MELLLDQFKDRALLYDDLVDKSIINMNHLTSLESEATAKMKLLMSVIKGKTDIRINDIVVSSNQRLRSIKKGKVGK